MSWLQTIASVILCTIVGAHIYFFSKLLYFFLPGVDTYGGPNVYLYLIGHILALWVMYKLAGYFNKKDPWTADLSIGLYVLANAGFMLQFRDMEWYYYALLFMLGGIWVFFHRKKHVNAIAKED